MTKEKINVFIDTNVIDGDWFLRSKNMKILIYLIKTGIVDLYVSSVVMEEFRKHFKSKVLELEKEAKGLSNKFNHLNIDNSLNYDDSIYSSQLIKNFDDNIVDHLVNHFHLVKYPENDNFKTTMDTIIYNAINEIAPFKAKDDGFRDSLIFESYLFKIKRMGLSNNYFINNDKIFEDEAVSKRIEDYGVQLEILKNFDNLFLDSRIKPYLEKNKNVILQERVIEEKVKEFINKYKDFISIKFFESFAEGLAKDNFIDSEPFTFFDFKNNRISFDYEFNDSLWISVNQEMEIKMIEFESHYNEISKQNERYRKRDFFIKVAGTTNIEINTIGIEDFNILHDDHIQLNSIDAEMIIQPYDYVESKYEDMPI